jgi:hypothetical protein
MDHERRAGEVQPAGPGPRVGLGRQRQQAVEVDGLLGRTGRMGGEGGSRRTATVIAGQFACNRVLSGRLPLGPRGVRPETEDSLFGRSGRGFA